MRCLLLSVACSMSVLMPLSALKAQSVFTCQSYREATLGPTASCNPGSLLLHGIAVPSDNLQFEQQVTPTEQQLSALPATGSGTGATASSDLSLPGARSSTTRVPATMPDPLRLRRQP